MYDSDGRPIDPSRTGLLGAWLCGYKALHEAGDEEAESDPEHSYATYVTRIVESMQSYWQEKNRKRRVLLFIHGGMNSQGGSIRHATRLAKLIREALLRDGSLDLVQAEKTIINNIRKPT